MVLPPQFTSSAIRFYVRRSSAFRGCLLILWVLGFASPGWLMRGAEPVKRAFDIRGGLALETLPQFTAQADVQLLYSADAVKEITTPAVKGTLTAVEALTRMFAGTGVIVAHNPADGGLTLRRESQKKNGRRANPHPVTL